MKIGAHVSIAGDIKNAILNAKNIGADTIQIFLSPPQNWNPSKITDIEAKNFVKNCLKNNISPVFIHAIYLINLASDNPELIQKSQNSLIEYLNISTKIKSTGVIFHIGSSQTHTFEQLVPTLATRINQILLSSDPNSTLIIETNAGQGHSVGSTFEQIADIISQVKDKCRLGVCLDTAHTFASGYDWKGKGVADILDEFDHIIGLGYLKSIHVNDSKSAYNSHVDRHENIGSGQLGESFFHDLLHDKRLHDIPFILEVPGFENSGPDRQNIEILKKLSHK